MTVFSKSLMAVAAFAAHLLPVFGLVAIPQQALAQTQSPPVAVGSPVPAGSQAVAGAAAVTSSAPPVGGITADGGYRLGAADKVRIIVFNEPTLSGEFTISDNGALSLPLIGELQAGGRTTKDVIAAIEAKLADGYLRQPRVSLDVLTFRPFYILGEVSKPGEYPYSAGLTVMNAVARAEGFTYRANKRKVFLQRAGDPDEREVKLTPGLLVGPGDTIRIGERYF